MTIVRWVRGVLDRISGRSAAEERDARLEQVDRRIDAARQQHLRILEERQNIQRRRQQFDA